VVFVDWMISRERTDLPPGVKRLSTYPLGRYLRAFDFAISAAGYNSYHELIGFGVPTIFVPSEKLLDDQHGRARYAKDVGVALSLDTFTELGLDECLEVMLDHDRRRSMTDRCRELFPGNGAAEAAGAISGLLAHVPEHAGIR
jgi:UDP:flavonoid glycosyltransferase YjiC (YdhE family)